MLTFKKCLWKEASTLVYRISTDPQFLWLYNLHFKYFYWFSVCTRLIFIRHSWKHLKYWKCEKAYTHKSNFFYAWTKLLSPMDWQNIPSTYTFHFILAFWSTVLLKYVKQKWREKDWRIIKGSLNFCHPKICYFGILILLS